MELLSEKPEIEDLPDALTMKQVRGDIHFDQVSFRYGDEGEWILRGIDLSIPQGHTVALVGMSGGANHGSSAFFSKVLRYRQRADKD